MRTDWLTLHNEDFERVGSYDPDPASNPNDPTGFTPIGQTDPNWPAGNIPIIELNENAILQREIARIQENVARTRNR